MTSADQARHQRERCDENGAEKTPHSAPWSRRRSSPALRHGHGSWRASWTSLLLARSLSDRTPSDPIRKLPQRAAYARIARAGVIDAGRADESDLRPGASEPAPAVTRRSPSAARHSASPASTRSRSEPSTASQPSSPSKTRAQGCFGPAWVRLMAWMSASTEMDETQVPWALNSLVRITTESVENQLRR
jgi:hypothetical protein